METRNPSEEESGRRLPERMFALGEEPVGVRVTPYHKPFAIRDIIRSLDEDEVQVLRTSPFGKLVEIAEKPTFSGRFGRYIISRQLKVKKKHEAWFLFAGKPIRFSLREFAKVTGLNCNKFPPRVKRKAKRAVEERPYWAELFGTLKEVPVSSVLRMLKNRSVTDRETRIKYAFLALLAAVVLPTTHTPRISHECAEQIKDLEAFLAYPWGRVSFDLLMSSIKERNEVSLSQNTIALKGFVMSLQLVMIEAVPALTEGVHEGGLSGSDNEYSDDEEHHDDERNGKRSICPGHARETDIAAKASVLSIISLGHDEFSSEAEFRWSDDEEDEGVENVVKLIEEGYLFNPAVFTGGASHDDVERMREDTRNEAEGRKTKKNKGTDRSCDVHDVQSIGTVVASRLQADFNRLSEEVNRVSDHLSTMATDIKIFRAAFATMESSIVKTVQDMFNNFEMQVLNKVSQPVNVTPLRREEDVHMSPVVNCSVNTTYGAKMGVDGYPVTSVTHIHDDNEARLRRDQLEQVVQGTTLEATICLGEPSSRRSSEVEADDIIESARRFAENQSCPNKLSESLIPECDQVVASEDTNSPLPTADLAPTTMEPAVVEIPQFSLGLSQEELKYSAIESEIVKKDTLPTVTVQQGDAPGIQLRKSKRQKVVPKGLVGEYECDKKFLTRAWDAHVARTRSGDDNDDGQKYRQLTQMFKTPFSFFVNGVKIDSKDISALVERSSHVPAKVVDVLIHHMRSVYDSASDHIPTNPVVFFDTKFVSQLSKIYGRFSKTVNKELFKFPPTLLDTFISGCTGNDLASRFYFPFNFDKTHWVGLCIDVSKWHLQVLDSNISKRTDSTMFKELGQFAEMFPHLLRFSGKHITLSDLKPLSIERPRIVPQIQHANYSAVSTVLFIEAHAFGGLEICKCITSNVVECEVEKLAVRIVDCYHRIG